MIVIPIIPLPDHEIIEENNCRESTIKLLETLKSHKREDVLW